MKGRIMFESCDVRIVEFGSLVALASVTLHNGMQVRGFKIINAGNGEHRVSMPSREVMRDGCMESYPLIRFECPNAKGEFEKLVLAAYERERSLSE